MTYRIGIPKFYAACFLICTCPIGRSPVQSAATSSNCGVSPPTLSQSSLSKAFVHRPYQCGGYFRQMSVRKLLLQYPNCHKHAGLGDLDFLSEMIYHAHRNNIRVIGYYSNIGIPKPPACILIGMAEEADGTTSYKPVGLHEFAQPISRLLVTRI